MTELNFPTFDEFIKNYNTSDNKKLMYEAAIPVGLGSAGWHSYLVPYFNSKEKALNDWDKATAAVADTKAFKSPVTGRLLQVSPEEADKVLDTYVNTANDLASTKLGPFRAGKVLSAIRLGPKMLKEKLFGGGLSDGTSGLIKHYNMFSDPAADRNKLKAHMLDVFRWQKGEFPDEYYEEMSKSMDSLSPDIKKILSDSSSMSSKYDTLKNLKDRSGLDFFEKYVLGEGTNPGAVKFIGGGNVGKINPDTLGVVDKAIHPGFARNYINGVKPALKGLSALNKLGIGGGLAGAALAGYNLYKNASITKKADEGRGEFTNSLIGTTSGGVAFAGAMKSIEDLKRLAEDIRKSPNMNVGFTYGALQGIGDGHKTPAANIRKILERAVANLPDKHPMKAINFVDIANMDHGISPNVAKDLNILYNTGLGSAKRLGNVIGNPYYTKYMKHVTGDAQSIRNYLTDTPAHLHFKFGDVPSFGAAVAPNALGWNTGYNAGDVKTIGYGNIDLPHRALHNLTPVYEGSILNTAPDIVGTPFVNPDLVDKLQRLDTRDKKIAELSKVIDNLEDAGQKASLKGILSDVANGKKLVTIAGSGRGDYTVERAMHMLDSLDRLGLKDNVIVAPLLGKYTGLNDVTAAERAKIIDSMNKVDPRLRTFGALKNDAYTLLQQISDLNMASTGQMAISEAANSGNIQVIPRSWHDFVKVDEQVSPNAKWHSSMLKDLLGRDVEKMTGYGEGLPHLDNWNEGSIKTFPEQMGDVFKRMEDYEGELRPGVANYFRKLGISDDSMKHYVQKFDTDPFAKLLTPEKANEFKELSARASEAARNNLNKIPEAQKALANDMFSTINKNIFKQKIKALPGVAGGLGMLGIGGYGLYNAFSHAGDSGMGNLNLGKLSFS